MPFEKGHKKMGGRQKGIPNKSTQVLADLWDLCEKEGLQPFEAMLRLANSAGADKKLKFNCLKELCEYLYPKRSRVEFEGHAYMHIVKEIEELSKLPTEELKKLARAEIERLSGDE